MKKSATLILLSLFSSCMSFAQGIYVNIKSPYDTLMQKQVAKPPTPIPIPPTGNFGILTPQEQLFDNVYYTYGSLGWTGSAPSTTLGTPAINNSEVGILQTMKGGIDITYKGRTATPGASWPAVAMDAKIPILISDDGQPGKWLSFKNVASTQYESNSFAGIVPPYEVWFVFRYLPGQSYEALFEGGNNAAYVGDLATTMRIINPNYGTVPGSVKPGLYATHIGRLVLSSQSSASWYLDGVLIGTIALQSPDLNSIWKTIFNVGVVTNQSDWDFAALYFKNGAITDPTIYAALATKWGVGTLPNHILLDNIGYTVKNGVYTPQATLFGSKTALDISKYSFKWYGYNGDLGVQTLVSTAYQPKLTGYNSYKVLIMASDNWRYFEGTYQ